MLRKTTSGPIGATRVADRAYGDHERDPDTELLFDRFRKATNPTGTMPDLPGADRMRVDDLSVLILQQVAVAAVEHTRRALREGSRVLVRVHALTAGLHPNQADLQPADRCRTYAPKPQPLPFVNAMYAVVGNSTLLSTAQTNIDYSLWCRSQTR
jgi:hypothetical protein